MTTDNKINLINPITKEDNLLNSDLVRVTGVYEEPRDGGTRPHKGLDYAVAIGTPVYAAAGGTVIKAVYEHPQFGNYVVVKHSNGESTLYAHLDSDPTSLYKQQVSQGDMVGKSGNTGLKKDGSPVGRHLHFEVIDKTGTTAIENTFNSQDRVGISGQLHRIDPSKADSNSTPDLASAKASLTNAINQDNGLSSEQNAKDWFDTFSDSLTTWTGSAANFIKDTIGDISSILQSPSTAISTMSSWIGSSFKTANTATAQKNFFSLGIDSTQFNFSQNTFAGHTFIDTSLSFNLTNTFASYSYSDSSSGSNNTDYTYNNFKNLNFTLSNPIKDALNHLGNARNHASPLAIDLDNDGIETTHLSEGNVFFDIKNSGFANRVGWIKADDGILALDRSTIGANGEVIAANGTIDNVTELFGDYRMSAWDELKLLDTNHNNKIDSGDEQFNNLKIWQDLNQNGISEAAELKSLSEHNIKEINLANITKTDIYQNENHIH